MSTKVNKATARRFFVDVFSQGNLAVLEEIIAPDYREDGPSAIPGLPTGPAGSRIHVEVYRSAFPDLSFTIGEQVAEGDMVTTRWTAHGTHKGELSGIPPTGRSVTISGVSIDKIVDGKLVAGWSISDQYSLLQQLGVIPA